MEREQATLPFVVPSHLSGLFGLKASVIVVGREGGGMRVRDREREGVPGANSTCWGDGETAVTEEGEHSGVFFNALSAHVFFHSSLFLLKILHAPPQLGSFISYRHFSA